MIKTIIFDFGDVFINLDKEATPKALLQLGITWNNEFKELDLAFEKGEISPNEFIETLHNKAPTTTKKELLKAWNAVLLDFPLYRLTFLIKLSKTYNLILLSNTDYLHFKHFEEKVGQEFASSFYTCFNQKYFSYELGMRKPERAIFEIGRAHV